MKCNHCNYVHGWDAETLTHCEGDHGKFFSLPIQLERTRQYDGCVSGTERRELVGCPNCGNTQIEVD